MRIKSRYLFNLSFALLLAGPISSLAQVNDDSDTSDSDYADIDEIARELSHPATSLRSYGFKVNYSTFSGSLPGANNQTETMLSFRPAFPVHLSNGKNIIIRADINMHQSEPEWRVDFDSPIWRLDEDYNSVLLRQSPQVTAETGRFHTAHGHLADVDFDVAYGGASDNGFISMYGIAGTIPYPQNISSGSKQMLLGPEAAFGKSADWGVTGF